MNDWRARALCRGVAPAFFFPDNKADSIAAEEFCRGGCPVRLACLEYALTHGEKEGVWGGLNERKRRSLRSDRRVFLRNSRGQFV